MGRLSTREAVETAVGKAADDAVLSYVTSIVEDDDFEWGPDCEEAAEIFGPMLASCRDPPRSRAAASAPRWAQTDSAVLPPARPPPAGRRRLRYQRRGCARGLPPPTPSASRRRRRTHTERRRQQQQQPQWQRQWRRLSSADGRPGVNGAAEPSGAAPIRLLLQQAHDPGRWEGGWMDGWRRRDGSGWAGAASSGGQGLSTKHPLACFPFIFTGCIPRG
jgi:hypothetical protein